VWEDIPVVDRDYVTVVMAPVREAHRWRREYEVAKHKAAARAGPDAAWGPVDSNSATTSAAAPASNSLELAMEQYLFDLSDGR